MQDNENGKIKNYNLIELSNACHDHKPTKDEVRELQSLFKSKIVEVTPSSLGKAIEQGHSFHPAFFKRGVVATNQYTGKEFTVTTFRNEALIGQNVFAVDIDHHNFTVEEVIKRCPVPPSLIYKTHSYCDTNRRYRVVFFCDKAIKSLNEIERINITLSSVFLENLPTHVLAFSDLTAVNPSRLFFGGLEVVHVDDSARFSVSSLMNNKILVDKSQKTWELAQKEVSEHKQRVSEIEKYRDYLTDKEWETYQELSRSKCKKSYDFMKRIGEKLITKGIEWTNPNFDLKKVDTDNKKLKPVASRESRPVHANLLNSIFEAIPSYVTEPLPACLEYEDAINFVNQLPLDDLLGVSLEKHFNSLLRDEDNASAIVFKGKDMLFYHDFGNGETLTTVGLLSKLMTVEYGTLFYSNLEMILQKCGSSLGSEYKKEALFQISEGKKYVRNIMKGAKSPSQQMFNHGLGALYSGCCNLLSLYISSEPLLENCDGVVIYRPLNKFHEELLEGNDADVQKMRVKCYKRFVQKLNFLCWLGFFKKIKLEDLNSKTREGVERHKRKMIVEKEIDEADYLFPNFYYFAPVTPELIAEATKRYELFKERGGKLSNISQKILRSIDEELTSQTFLQSDFTLNKKEKHFKKLCSASATKLLNEHGYFTEEMLLKPMLRKDDYYNGTKDPSLKIQKLIAEHGEKSYKVKMARSELGFSRKKQKFDTIRVELLMELNLKDLRANKENKKLYKLNDKLNGQTVVYVRK